MALTKVTKDQVRTTYNGRQGCACGCGGSYAETGPAVTRRLNLINANLDKVEVIDGLNETIYCLEDDERGRATRVYFVK